MPHSHDHRGARAQLGDRRVLIAVLVNIGLTAAQIAGGIIGGSLALVADAIHNLSDAVSLGIAFVARRIGRRPANDDMTFGYGRAEVVAALVNYTTLVVIAVYLVYEAIWRFFEPQGVDGWIVVIVAGVALAVDLVTAVLTYRMSKESVNIRAVFLHNLADALGSIAVIAAGTLIILFDWTIADALITLVIAGYILWLVGTEIGGVIRILMLGTPPDLSPAAVLETLRSLDAVDGVHHLHIWQLDEHESSLEAHLVVARAGGVPPPRSSEPPRPRSPTGTASGIQPSKSKASRRIAPISRPSATAGRRADDATVTLSFLESFPRNSRKGLGPMQRCALTGGWAVDLLASRAGLPRSNAGQILPFSSRRMDPDCGEDGCWCRTLPGRRVWASDRAGAECAAG